jgi:hypothetical protein
MKIQVTKSQFIETDDIVFAEEDELDPHGTTRVYLRDRQEPVTVNVDYDMFVWTINQKHLDKTGSHLIRT